MMRVSFSAKYAPLSAGLIALSSLAVLSACSSEPLDSDNASEGDAGKGSVLPGNAGSAGSRTDTPIEGGADSGGSSAGGSAPVAEPAGGYQKREYPAGPYGTGLGATLEDFSFLGWHDPVAAAYDATKLETVSLSEYYDPDGSKGIKLIWINASAVWCSVCRTEMKDIKNNGVNATFKPKGVQMLVTLFEDNRSGPAKPSDLHNWGSLPDHSIDFPLVLDPGFKLGTFFTSDATPLNMLVDARTMKVVSATMGYSLDYWQQVDRYLSTLE